jgi:hypothetical protein
MAYADATDVAVELGRPTSSVSDEETAQWGAWLARVERTIERGFRRAGLTLDEQIGLGDPLAADVRDVEVAAVVRKVQNPTWGEDSTTRSVDDMAVTLRRKGDGTTDPLALLDDEWAALLPSQPNRARAFSLMPS